MTRASLTDFGKYVADNLPKYVQKVQLTAGDELEILICPEGVVPTLQFLKDHHGAQFTSLADIGGMDVPSRKYRFEVKSMKCGYLRWNSYRKKKQDKHNKIPSSPIYTGYLQFIINEI